MNTFKRMVSSSVLLAIAAVFAFLLTLAVGVTTTYADSPSASDADNATAGDSSGDTSSETNKPTQPGWFEDDEGGRYYYSDPEGKPLVGWKLIDGTWYYLDPSNDGLALTGKYEVGGSSYISNDEGAMYESQWVEFDGSRYYATSSGALATGWLNFGGIWYYLNGSGAMTTGWQWVGGAWYYMDASGKMLTGWVLDGGTWYYCNGSGAMLTGWQWVGGAWYYLNGSGAMLTGWQWVGGAWYYLKDSGAMATGWILDGETWYYANGSGAMLTGWLNLGGTWYYLNGSGAMLTGWQWVGGAWYYLKDSGAMAVGWVLDGDTWYYLRSSGAMATGWVQVGGIWYYLNGSGAMLTGWQKVGGGWYYLYASGAMAANTTIDGYRVNGSGAWDPAASSASTAGSLNVGQQTDQVIFVQTSGTYATVWMEEKDSNGVWQRVIYTSKGRIGSNGLGKVKEGDHKTPRGVFDLGMVFGIQPDPGSKQPYLQVDSSHYWVGDSSSPYYNQMVSTRDVPLSNYTKNDSEHIVDYGAVYNYCIDMGYNTSRTPYKGAALFLHCLGRGSTAGCVAIPQADLVAMIQRLHDDTMIVIGTEIDITSA